MLISLLLIVLGMGSALAVDKVWSYRQAKVPSDQWAIDMPFLEWRMQMLEMVDNCNSIEQLDALDFGTYGMKNLNVPVSKPAPRPTGTQMITAGGRTIDTAHLKVIPKRCRNDQELLDYVNYKRKSTAKTINNNSKSNYKTWNENYGWL